MKRPLIVLLFTAVAIHVSPDGSRSSQYCSKLVPPFRKTVSIGRQRDFPPGAEFIVERWIDARSLLSREPIEIVACGASTHDVGHLTKYLAGRGSGMDAVGEPIHIAVDRHAHLLEGQRQFQYECRIDIRLHAQTDASRRFLRLCRILIAQPPHHSLNRFQELPHLRKDLIPLRGGQDDGCAPIRSRRRPSF
jgi:hypothetical protein